MLIHSLMILPSDSYAESILETRMYTGDYLMIANYELLKFAARH